MASGDLPVDPTPTPDPMPTPDPTPPPAPAPAPAETIGSDIDAYQTAVDQQAAAVQAQAAADSAVSAANDAVTQTSTALVSNLGAFPDGAFRVDPSTGAVTVYIVSGGKVAQMHPVPDSTAVPAPAPPPSS